MEGSKRGDGLERDDGEGRHDEGVGGLARWQKHHPNKAQKEIMSDDRELFISLGSAAERLGVCIRTVRRLGERGELPKPVKVGRCSRLPLSEVETYMNRLKEAR